MKKKKYKVGVIRTVHQFLEIEVEAGSTDEAKETALDECGDYEFPAEKSSEYSIDYVTKEK